MDISFISLFVTIFIFFTSTISNAVSKKFKIRGPKNEKFMKVPGKSRGKPFSMCNIQDNAQIEELFPGLFVTEEDILNLPEVSGRHNNGKRRNKPKVSKRIKVGETMSLKRHARKAVSRFTRNAENTAFGLGSGINSPLGVSCECCETSVTYEVYEEIPIGQSNYTVVNFSNSFQFVPAGRCNSIVPTCGTGGSCIQRYRHHWVMIYNTSLSYWPPIQFAAYSIPSHCEWGNFIG